jgi:beta-N-acetylhexosaminidase
VSGPIMMNIESTTLTDEDRELLQHPLIGGVIYFSRNYESTNQIKKLSETIKLISEALLISVDHEGGRVQRFREGFTHLPAAGKFGQRYDREPEEARELARETAWLMATELRAVGVDFSYAPVLDLDLGISEVIGDRGFHGNPETVAILAQAWLEGTHEAGMAAVGKHFPGHGSVAPDSHVAIPESDAAWESLEEGMLPFRRLVDAGIDALMPAHIIFNKIDKKPVGFSKKWLQHLLRKELMFNGAILSDDMSMKGASAAGNLNERCQLALDVGSDMVLACNDREGLLQLVENLRDTREQASVERLAKLRGRNQYNMLALKDNKRWQRARKLIDEA